MHGLRKIISGGQTGVDRAALDASLDLNFECGGWCPEGRLAEDGPIPDRYPLTELSGAGYEERTLSNLLDSDATLVIYFGLLSGGTLETVEWCVKNKKPVKTINAKEVSIIDAVKEIDDFFSINKNHIQVLNVAGPRMSKQVLAHSYTYELIQKILKVKL